MSDVVQHVCQQMVNGEHVAARAHLEDIKRLFGDLGLTALLVLLQLLLAVHSSYHSLEAVSERRDGDRESCREGGFLDGVTLFQTQLTLVRETTTAFHGFLLRATADIEAFAEVLVHFFTHVQSRILLNSDFFMSPLLSIHTLRAARQRAARAAESCPVCVSLLQQLQLEADLLESLLTAEYKVSLLKGVECFVDLARAEQLLEVYCADRTSALHNRDDSHVTTLSGLSAHSSRVSPRRRGPDGLHRSTASAPAAVVVETVSKLDQFYLWFHAHSAGRLRLLCGGGFLAAPLAAEDPPCRHTPPRGRSDVPSCAYMRDLRLLAEREGVDFVGVFANAQQFPHLNEDLRAGRQDPLKEAAWLLPPLEIPSSGADPAAGFRWWALAFASKVSTGLQAVETWRHMPEFQALRAALGKACSGRHTTSRTRPGHVQSQASLEGRRDGQANTLTASLPVSSPLSASLCVASSWGQETFGSWSTSLAPPSPSIHSQSPWVRKKKSEVRNDKVSEHMDGYAECSLCAAAVDVPDGPMESCPEDVSASPFRCLVVPLDLGWFQSPLFVGLVFRVAGSPPSGSPHSSGVENGAPMLHAMHTMSCLARPRKRERIARAWQRIRQWRGEGRPDGDEEGCLEDADVALRRDLLQFAMAVSGRKLRLMTHVQHVAHAQHAQPPCLSTFGGSPV